MAHHHGGHCHVYVHRSYYGRGYGGGSSWLEVGIMIGILLLILVGYAISGVHHLNAWNHGIHEPCGRPYTFSICRECGYIEDIYCEPCGYHREIPEWLKLEETD